MRGGSAWASYWQKTLTHWSGRDFGAVRFDDIRRSCEQVAARARWVTIDLDRLTTVEPGPAPELDAERHYLEGTDEDVAAYLLTLDTINFGSGWFPTLRKRPGCSGYFTVAWALSDRFRADGPWSNAELEALEPRELAAVARPGPGSRADGAVRRGAPSARGVPG